MGFSLFGWLRIKKQLEPQKVELIRGLEKKVGSLSNKNVSAMRTYVETLATLGKEYDVSTYRAKIDLYRPFLNKQT